VQNLTEIQKKKKSNDTRWFARPDAFGLEAGSDDFQNALLHIAGAENEKQLAKAKTKYIVRSSDKYENSALTLLHNYVSKSLQYKDGYSVIVINY
jgi:hypothetical protein